MMLTVGSELIDMSGGGEPGLPEARALQYSPERRRAYLPCSGWVREEPRRYGRLNADSRNRTAIIASVGGPNDRM